MDAGATGGVIGLGVILCVITSYFLHEKSNKIKQKWNDFILKYKQQKQPLLPIKNQNPLLIRRSSKKFQMKDLVGAN